MESLDAVRINFNPDQLMLLNICLAFIMFGIALDIKISDFKRLLQNPRAPLIGLISEYLLLPILTLILIYLIQPTTSIALGMLLLSVCPGGSTSNFMVHLSGANTALSVLLTSITTLGAIVVTPLLFTFLTNFIPSNELATTISVSPAAMMKTILQLLLIPVCVGMYLSEKHPKFTQKIEKPVKTLSMIIFFSFVVFAIKGNYENIKAYVHIVFFIVLIHNGLAFVIGYYFAKINQLNQPDTRAISIETGIQNSGLALIIIFNFFDGLGGMALIVAWWGVWHLISGFCLAMFWKKSALR